MSRLRVACAGVAAGLLLLPAGVAAQPGPTAEQPSPGQPDDDVATPGGSGEATALELVDQSLWLPQGEPFEAEVRVPQPADDLALQVVVHGRLSTRSAFEASLDDQPGAALVTGPLQPLTELPTTAAGTVTAELLLDGSAGGTRPTQEGVHPVTLRLLDTAGVVHAELVTHLVVMPAEGIELPSLAVAPVVDITSPPTLRPDGEVEIPDVWLDRLRERVTVLQQAPSVPLTLAPRPETLDGLAGLDDETGAELLAELVEARQDRPVLARPYTDVDIAELTAAELIGELNLQAESGADVIRSRLGVEPTPGTWLPRGRVGQAAARQRVELGADRAVVDAVAVDEVPGIEPDQVALTPFQLGEDGPLAMVSEPEVTRRITGEDGVLGAHRVAAELAMIWAERPGVERGVVVHLPPDRAIDPELVARALELVEDSPVLEPVPLDGLFDRLTGAVTARGEAPPVAQVARHATSTDLTAVAGPLQRARDAVSGYGGTVGDLDTGQSLERSLLLATGQDASPDERMAYAGRVNRALLQLSDVVRAPDTFRITLTSRSSSVPLNLTNTSDQPVDVRIELTSTQLQFPEGDVIPATLEPGPNRFDLQVRALASGAFGLDIVVASPDGAIVLEQTRFDIRSTAVSGVGLVLSLGAGFFLLAWWVRHWRNGRRAELSPRAATVATPGGDGAATDGHDDMGVQEDDGLVSRRPAGDRSGRRDRHRPAHMAGRRRRYE